MIGIGVAATMVNAVETVIDTNVTEVIYKAGESQTINEALKLMGIGMGGIFIVMILLFFISKLLLFMTVPKKDT